MTQYRIVDFQGTPLSDWTDDRKHLDDYLATRPVEIGKQTVQSTDDPDYDPDTITSITELDSTYPDRIATWEGRCGYIGDLGILQSDLDNEERFHEFEAAAQTADTQGEPPESDEVMTMTSGELLQRLIDRADDKEDPTYFMTGKVELALNQNQLEAVISGLYEQGGDHELADRLRALYIAEYGSDRWDVEKP